MTIMDSALSLYSENSVLIDFIKDVILVIGLYKVIRYIWRWQYTVKTSEIGRDLGIREGIEGQLESYVLEKAENGKKDIAVRFIHWKNYPHNLENDAYKHHLWINFNEGRTLPSGWIDNTGLKFQEHLWFYGQNLYLDDNGIFFFSAGTKEYTGFKRIPNVVLVVHMPFSNIVNFDFKQKIEYECILYTRHPYSKYKKLYSDEYIIREKYGQPYLRIELSRRHQLGRYRWVSYMALRAKIALSTLFK